MIISMLLTTVLAGQAGQPAAATNAAPAARIQRPLLFSLQARPRRVPAAVHAGSRDGEEREIVCGMVVVKKSPAVDSAILLPPRETGAAVRRVEPDRCQGRKIVPAK
jgi:hypothetical protein